MVGRWDWPNLRVIGEFVMFSVVLALALAGSPLSPSLLVRPQGPPPSGSYPLPYFNDAQVTPSGSDSISVSALVNYGEAGNESSNLKLYVNKDGATTTLPNGVFGSITVLKPVSGNGFFSWDNLWSRVGDKGNESQTFTTLTRLKTLFDTQPPILYYQYIYTFNIKCGDGLFHAGMVGGPGFSYNP
jgi:hypothetical protein